MNSNTKDPQAQPRNGTTTIVTLTPMALEGDSRTFKQAAAAARAGYRSIVVELGQSDMPQDSVPFEVIGTGGSPPTAAESSPESHGGVGLRVFLKRAPEPLKWSWRAVYYVAKYVVKFGIATARRTPPASLYYLHAFYQFPAVYYLSRRYGVPYIYDAHDFYQGIERDDEISWAHRYLTRPFERWLERQCIKNAAAVVTVADGIAAQLRSTYGCDALVIRNCQDSRLEQERLPGLRETVGVNSDDFLVVVIGNAKKGQALLEMLQAIVELPEAVHVAFLGAGYAEMCAEEVQRLELGRRVHFVPPVKPFEIVPFVRSADATAILYYPRSVNYANCLPNGFFQSLAAELPVLYPDLHEIKKVAERFDVGICIDPQDPQSLRAGIETLRNDPARYKELRRNLEKAHSSLDWVNEEAHLMKLIADVLAAKE